MPLFFHGPMPVAPPLIAHVSGFAGTLPGDDHGDSAAGKIIGAIVSGAHANIGPDETADYEGLITGGGA